MKRITKVSLLVLVIALALAGAFPVSPVKADDMQQRPPFLHVRTIDCLQDVIVMENPPTLEMTSHNTYVLYTVAIGIDTEYTAKATLDHYETFYLGNNVHNRGVFVNHRKVVPGMTWFWVINEAHTVSTLPEADNIKLDTSDSRLFYCKYAYLPLLITSMSARPK